MSLLSIFEATLAGIIFLLILRFIHIIGAPRGRRGDDETYEAGYYPIEFRRRLRMQYLRRIMTFLAAEGFIVLGVFMPYIGKELALDILAGIGILLGATFKVKRYGSRRSDPRS